MKQIIRLAWSYLKYYRKQTMALFLGIVLSCALFTGIGSLQKSGNHAAREKCPTQNPETGTIRCAVTQTGLRSLRKRISREKKSRVTAWKNRCADDAQSDRGAL